MDDVEDNEVEGSAFNLQHFLTILPKQLRRRSRIVLSHIRPSIRVDKNYYVTYKDYNDQDGSSLIELLEYFLASGILAKHAARPNDALNFFM